MQLEINKFLMSRKIKDLVGSYGELLVSAALGGARKSAVNQGFDIYHEEYGRIEVKTRKYEIKSDGTVVKESRAVGFSNKEEGFDWLAHVVLDCDYMVKGACLVHYSDVWPLIRNSGDKIAFSKSSSLPSSIDILAHLQRAQQNV